MKKNNAWNIRRLVDESFVPASQRTSVLYCRLTDFKSDNRHQELTVLIYTYAVGEKKSIPILDMVRFVYVCTANELSNDGTRRYV